MPGSRSHLKLRVCAAITMDGKLDEVRTGSELFGQQPGDVLLTDKRVAERAQTGPVVTVTGHEDLAELLRGLWAQRNARRVVCCGGAGLFRRLFAENLVDEVSLVVRSRIDGRREAETLSGPPGEYFPASFRGRLLKMEVRGNECFLHYQRMRTKPKSAPASRVRASVGGD